MALPPGKVTARLVFVRRVGKQPQTVKSLETGQERDS
jgi:hypothetical protein